MICMENSTELKSLISKGNVLYIKHSDMSEPSLSVVQSINEKEIQLSVPSTFADSKMKKGACIDCQLLEGDYEYVIQGIVDDIHVAHQGTLNILIEKVSKYKNNRVFKRYAVNFHAEIYMAGAEKSIEATVKNISIIGAGIASKEHMHKDSIISLKIDTFISDKESLSFKARVVREVNSGKSYEYGLEIIDIDDMNRNILDKLIFCLNTNENIFIEDLIK